MPTVSLVLGGSHSIGVPPAVSTDYSFIHDNRSLAKRGFYCCANRDDDGPPGAYDQYGYWSFADGIVLIALF